MKYELNKHTHSCQYLYVADTITIASPDLNRLTDNEQLEYISDSITHEHIHRAIKKLFGLTACKLFDGIECGFRNHNLHLFAWQDIPSITYKEYIDAYGFNAFLEHYHITETAFNQAYIVCNNRLKGEI